MKLAEKHRLHFPTWENNKKYIDNKFLIYDVDNADCVQIIHCRSSNYNLQQFA